MGNLLRYMLVAVIAIMWGVRIIITINSQYGLEFMGITPYNNIAEITVLFTTLLSMVLIVRKNVFGPVILLVSNAAYYGAFLINEAMVVTENFTIMDAEIQLQITFSLIAIILGVASCFEWLVTKNKEKFFRDTKRDWFFANDNLTKEVDDRQDENHYRL